MPEFFPENIEDEVKVLFLLTYDKSKATIYSSQALLILTHSFRYSNYQMVCSLFIFFLFCPYILSDFFRVWNVYWNNMHTPYQLVHDSGAQKRAELQRCVKYAIILFHISHINFQKMK